MATLTAAAGDASNSTTMAALATAEVELGASGAAVATPAPALPSARVAPPATDADGPVPTCTVPGLNVWGPGWLADPLELSFEFDDVLAPFAPFVRF